MKTSSFNTLLENMPDSINVSAIERLGKLCFDCEIDFKSGDYEIKLEVYGFQRMDIVSMEEFACFEVNKDNLIEFNYIEYLSVWNETQFIKLIDVQEKRLLKTIIKLINIEL